MAVDKSVLTTIASAVEADPANIPLRLHLAGLLFDDGQYDASLEQCQGVLARVPD